MTKVPAVSARHAPASYPATSLSLCMRKTALAMEAMPALADRGWTEQEGFASACGYKGFSGNSAPKGLIAALGHFGLIERDSQKRIRFSDEYLKAVAGGEASRSDLVQKAVRRPKVHQALFSQFGADQAPSRVAIAKHLEGACGFAARPAQIMASNFLEDLALSRSLSAPENKSVESINLPSGAKAMISSDKELGRQDWEFMESFAKLKASAVQFQG